jgi:hypothetical protein
MENQCRQLTVQLLPISKRQNEKFGWLRNLIKSIAPTLKYQPGTIDPGRGLA